MGELLDRAAASEGLCPANRTGTGAEASATRTSGSSRTEELLGAPPVAEEPPGWLVEALREPP